MNSKQKKSGFSLVELLIYTLIGSSFLLLSFSTLSNFFNTRRRYEALNSLDGTAMFLFNTLNRDVHQSTMAYTNEDPTSSIFSLEKNEEGTVVYSVDDGQLVRNYASFSARGITVDAFEVLEYSTGDGSIPCYLIKLELSTQANRQTVSSNYQTTISLRQIPFMMEESE